MTYFSTGDGEKWCETWPLSWSDSLSTQGSGQPYRQQCLAQAHALASNCALAGDAGSKVSAECILGQAQHLNHQVNKDWVHQRSTDELSCPGWAQGAACWAGSAVGNKDCLEGSLEP